MTLDMFFDYLGVRLNGPKAQGKTIKLNCIFTDIDQEYAVLLDNCVLTYTPRKQFAQPDVTLTMTKAILDAINMGATTFEQEISFSSIKVTGDSNKFKELLSLMDTFEQSFAIVTP
jgi:alkyl sulfatase BDS1-like metallo-beta-lactamase superfamily hydrolase